MAEEEPLEAERGPSWDQDIDINIFLPPEHEEAVLSALGGVYDLADQGCVREALLRDGQARSSWGDTYVDLFLANTDFHTSMPERVEHQPFEETTIPVLSIEDLLICKALFDRSKEWVDIEAVAKTHRGDLDGPYITAWLDRFLPVDDLRRRGPRPCSSSPPRRPLRQRAFPPIRGNPPHVDVDRRLPPAMANSGRTTGEIGTTLRRRDPPQLAHEPLDPGRVG